jgi:quercetin dioxygenase-like cupin family protein
VVNFAVAESFNINTSTMNKENRPVEIFAGTAWEAAVVKSLLENAEIEVFLKDEIRGTMVPWHISPGGTDAVTVVVSSADYENAKQVVDEYKANRSSQNA